MARPSHLSLILLVAVSSHWIPGDPFICDMSNANNVCTTRQNFLALQSNRKSICWGDSFSNGRCSGLDLVDAKTIYSNNEAFVVLYGNSHRATCWGSASSGGSCSAEDLHDVYAIRVTEKAFLALRRNHGGVCWGDALYGGDCEDLDLTDISEAYSTARAFLALKRSPYKSICWGNHNYGGDCSKYDLSDVSAVYANARAFVALKPKPQRGHHGGICWGDGDAGGDCGDLDFQNVFAIFSTKRAFVALEKEPHAGFCWGDPLYGAACRGFSLAGVRSIYSTERAFVALRDQRHRAMCWGDSRYGGNCMGLELSDIAAVYATDRAFFALKRRSREGICWGDPHYGGRCPESDLSGIRAVYATDHAFLALSHSEVVCWGNVEAGGECYDLSFSRVSAVYATSRAFFALESDNHSASCWGDPEFGGHCAGLDLAQLTPPPCDVFGSDEKPGLSCRCSRPGFGGIAWKDNIPYGTCEPCGPGTFSDAGICVMCGIGRFSTDSGRSSECEACAVGKYSLIHGATECQTMNDEQTYISGIIVGILGVIYVIFRYKVQRNSQLQPQRSAHDIPLCFADLAQDEVVIFAMSMEQLTYASEMISVVFEGYSMSALSITLLDNDVPLPDALRHLSYFFNLALLDIVPGRFVFGFGVALVLIFCVFLIKLEDWGNSKIENNRRGFTSRLKRVQFIFEAFTIAIVEKMISASMCRYDGPATGPTLVAASYITCGSGRQMTMAVAGWVGLIMWFFWLLGYSLQKSIYSQPVPRLYDFLIAAAIIEAKFVLGVCAAVASKSHPEYSLAIHEIIIGALLIVCLMHGSPCRFVSVNRLRNAGLSIALLSAAVVLTWRIAPRDEVSYLWLGPGAIAFLGIAGVSSLLVKVCLRRQVLPSAHTAARTPSIGRGLVQSIALSSFEIDLRSAG